MSFPPPRASGVRSLLRIIGLLSLVLALSACSAIKLGYTTLPELSYWWLDGFADFDDAQREPVRDDLARIHAWHRSEELARYAALLQQIEQLAATEFTPAQACAFEAPLRERAAAVLRRIEAPATALALTLKPEQVQHVERKFQQRNRDFAKEWADLAPDDLQSKRAKEIAERAETVYGTLNDAQWALVRSHVRATAWSPAVVLAERRRRQQDTLAVLRQLAGGGAGIEPARAAMRRLLDGYLDSPDASYRAFSARYRLEICALTSALQAAATPSQRDYAVRRLRAWQRDLAELAAPR